MSMQPQNNTTSNEQDSVTSVSERRGESYMEAKTGREGELYKLLQNVSKNLLRR